MKDGTLGVLALFILFSGRFQIPEDIETLEDGFGRGYR
jgi:hypothetical protein